jgi:hypothetical protein
MARSLWWPEHGLCAESPARARGAGPPNKLLKLAAAGFTRARSGGPEATWYDRARPQRSGLPLAVINLSVADGEYAPVTPYRLRTPP